MKTHIFYFLILFSLISCDKKNLPDVNDPGDNGQDSTKIEYSLLLQDTICRADNYTDEKIALQGLSSLFISESNPSAVFKETTLYMNGDDAWLFFPNISLAAFQASDISHKIMINGSEFRDGDNVYVTNYYNGTFIKPIPIGEYSGAVLSATEEVNENAKPVSLYTIYTDNGIPVGDNGLKSIFLKRGHMITVAENADGTGRSEVFIAVDENKHITLSNSLQGEVSFVRVLPWNYSVKRGIGRAPLLPEELGMRWYYNWGLGEETSAGMEYVPMVWGKAGANRVTDLIKKKNTTHLLAFNEPDGTDQSNLSADEALKYYPKLLQTGLRIGSPACKEGAWKSWLNKFMNGCKSKGYRVDFIAIHWYDWGDWLANKNPSPENIDAMVNRMKKDIDDCYNKFKLPIWITEFNANKNRLTETQILFLVKAIPMLEAHPHVERYAYFQPNGDNGKRPGNGEFLDGDVILPVGKAYGSVESTPAYQGE